MSAAESQSGNQNQETGLKCETKQESKVFSDYNVSDFQKISTVGNICFGVIGLIAGVYYFFKRLSIEGDRDKIGRIREHTRILLSLIDDYDKTINSAINAPALRALGKSRRDELSRIFQSIQHFLEGNQSLLGLSETEMQDIMNFHSIIDNSRLSRGNYANGSQTAIRTEYKTALKQARYICWKKMY